MFEKTNHRLGDLSTKESSVYTLALSVDFAFISIKFSNIERKFFCQPFWTQSSQQSTFGSIKYWHFMQIN
ncbi:hypothetical protein BpHYR1_001502 [Brachionus plicatilis]|uniref:Uncharacterized protein n=1 Tax=Brachionus plicatilis TaxID=10195 RepID=A0A3M7QE17_BRAPC|nr:hypothetical protein BpHYR1_001502 [Brachionus plicatilis]